MLNKLDTGEFLFARRHVLRPRSPRQLERVAAAGVRSHELKRDVGGDIVLQPTRHGAQINLRGRWRVRNEAVPGHVCSDLLCTHATHNRSPDVLVVCHESKNSPVVGMTSSSRRHESFFHNSGHIEKIASHVGADVGAEGRSVQRHAGGRTAVAGIVVCVELEDVRAPRRALHLTSALLKGASISSTIQ